MKTIKQVEIVPVFVEFIPEELEEAKIYISDVYSVSVHKCLCGCGFKTVLPLDPETGWLLSKNTNDERISFTPSILNPICKSHYIITNNKANFV